jgi:cell division inhibitor SepF
MLRKSMLYLGLVDDEAEYADGDGEYADHYGDSYPPEPGYEEPVPPSGTRGLRTVDRQERVTGVNFADRAPVRQAPPVARITTLHPRTYNDARGIGEEFRRGAPVIMNLTEMDEADAKRLVDFAAGLTFGRLPAQPARRRRHARGRDRRRVRRFLQPVLIPISAAAVSPDHESGRLEA